MYKIAFYKSRLKETAVSQQSTVEETFDGCD